MAYLPPHRRTASASAAAAAPAEHVAPAPAHKTHPYAAPPRRGGGLGCPTARRPPGASASTASGASAGGTAPHPLLNGVHAAHAHPSPQRTSSSPAPPHQVLTAGDTYPPGTGPGRRGGAPRGSPISLASSRPAPVRAQSARPYVPGVGGLSFPTLGGGGGGGGIEGGGYGSGLARSSSTASASSLRSHASTSSLAGSARRGIATHRARMVPQPSEMELLASVSRSGGIDPDGDALKNHDTQERFRVYIDEKIAQYHSTRGDGSEEQDALRNIVLLFRKLREGVVASARHDQFAIAALMTVFEDSVRYAVLAHDVPQLNAALHGLVPDLYRAVDAARAERAARAAESAATDGKSEPSDGDSVASPLPPPHTPYDDEYTECTPLLCVADNREHFASLLLLYHLVHSSREVYQATLDSLTTPPKPLYVAPAPQKGAEGDTGGDSSTTGGGDAAAEPKRTRLVRGPHGSRPFVRSSSVAFAQEAARTLADETFTPLAFRALVSGTSVSSPRTAAAEAPEALERALLAWATPKVRERASLRLRKSYMTATVPWVAHRLGIKEEAVHIWALAQGLRVQDGIVKLK